MMTITDDEKARLLEEFRTEQAEKLRKRMSELGKSKSKKKRKAVRKNQKKAAAARRAQSLGLTTPPPPTAYSAGVRPRMK